MSLKYFWIALFLVSTQSIFFKVDLPPLKHRCIFEFLSVNQKYNVDVKPLNNVPYELQINVQRQETQNSAPIYQRVVENDEHLFVHKLTAEEGVYEICILNHDPSKIFTYEISLKSGLQLMDLHLLPDNTDAQNLKQEIEWLKEQKDYFQELIEKSSHAHLNTMNYSNSLNLEMGLLTVVLTILILCLNAFFYLKFKESLKQRKLI